MERLAKFLVAPQDSIRDAMVCIDRNAKGIALVADKERHLIGTITDGDIRRAILAGVDLGLPVQVLLDQRMATGQPRPLTAPVGTSDAELLRRMNERSVRHIPLVDKVGCVMDVALLSDLVKEFELPLTAVVMAGGYGTRLRPLTEDLPKPMLPVGGRPLMEHIVTQLRDAGIRRVSITTHYKPEAIIQHFGNGEKYGVEISYVNEDRPLGTAGALGLMPMPPGPLLVINGDILTQVDFGAMVAYHQEHRASMTVGVRQYGLQVPYGVIECEGPYVVQVTEKPQLRFFVNAGIYLLEPAVHRHIRADRRFDMTDLIQRLLDAQQSVVSFPIHEYWLDIGQHPDYVRAQEDVENGRIAP